VKDADYAKAAAEDRAAFREGLMLAKAAEMVSELELGHDAAAAELADQCVASASEIKKTLVPSRQEMLIPYCRVRKSIPSGDYSELLQIASIKPANDWESRITSNAQRLGQLYTHDLSTADESTEELPKVDFDLYVDARMALERGDPNAVVLWSTLAKQEDDPAKRKAHDYMLRRSGTWLALAKARFGDLAGAQTLIAETPTDCRMCVDLRGRIAALESDSAAAEKWFAQAIHMAPQLPQVYIDRGQARLDRGEAVGALADASRAAALSPHDSDAWKLWGDALAKQGNTKEALAKYNEALRYAPNWKQLREAREAAARQKS
jgi:tetratricopeptide (TPR) repeat protein